MVDTNGLRAEMARNGLSIRKTAKGIEMPYVTLQTKLRTGYFTVAEAEKLSQFLGIKKPAEIFFAKKLS